MKFNIFDLICIILLSLFLTRFVFKGEKLERDDYIVTIILSGIFYSLLIILF
jgi:hypothetical protein